jgi:hypothetical protein
MQKRKEKKKERKLQFSTRNICKIKNKYGFVMSKKKFFFYQILTSFNKLAVIAW